MPKLPLYILAGGQSKRFGSDKARALLNSQPLIAHTQSQLVPVASTIIAVADQPDKYADLNLPTIADPTPHLGPLAGLLTALQHQYKHHNGGFIILAACDSLTLNHRWITTLTDALEQHTDNTKTKTKTKTKNVSPQHLAACFKDARFPQPMPGIYHTALIPLIRQQLNNNQRSFTRFLKQPETRTLTLPIPSDWPAQPSANTPQDLTP